MLLQKHGEPKHPQDLTEHQCLIYTNTDKPNTWILQGPEQIETVRVSGPVSADNGDILKTAAVSGLGITLLPTFIVGPEINAGRLQQILGDYCPPDIAIYAVFPSRRYLSAKVRAFVNFLTEKFGEHPDWDRF